MIVELLLQLKSFQHRKILFMWNFFVPFWPFLSTSLAQVLHTFGLVGDGGIKGKLVVVKNV